MMYKFKYYLNDNGMYMDTDIGHVSAPIFNVEHSNSTIVLKSISYVLRAEWNSLPSSFRNSEDLSYLNYLLNDTTKGNGTVRTLSASNDDVSMKFLLKIKILVHLCCLCNRVVYTEASFVHIEVLILHVIYLL